MGITKIKNSVDNYSHYIDSETVSLHHPLSLEDFYQFGHDYASPQNTDRELLGIKKFKIKNYPKIAQIMDDISLFQEKIKAAHKESILVQKFNPDKDFSKISSTLSIIFFMALTSCSFMHASSYIFLFLFLCGSFTLSGLFYIISKDTFNFIKLSYLKIRYWKQIKQHHLYQEKLVETLLEQISDQQTFLEVIEEYSNRELALSPLNIILRQLYKEFSDVSWNTKDYLRKLALSEFKFNEEVLPPHFEKAIWLLNLSEKSHHLSQKNDV